MKNIPAHQSSNDVSWKEIHSLLVLGQWQSTESGADKKFKGPSRRRAVQVPAQRAEVAKVPDRKRRSVSASPVGDTTGRLNINLEDLWELQKILEGKKGSREKDLQVSDGGERQSFGPEPEDGASPGDVGDSVREIGASQQRRRSGQGIRQGVCDGKSQRSPAAYGNLCTSSS